MRSHISKQCLIERLRQPVQLSMIEIHCTGLRRRLKLQMRRIWTVCWTCRHQRCCGSVLAGQLQLHRPPERACATAERAHGDASWSCGCAALVQAYLRSHRRIAQQCLVKGPCRSQLSVPVHFPLGLGRRRRGGCAAILGRAYLCTWRMAKQQGFVRQLRRPPQRSVPVQALNGTWRCSPKRHVETLW